jgi:hypothetical protein
MRGEIRNSVALRRADLQSGFPYRQFVEENHRRGFSGPEFELAETGVFDDNRISMFSWNTRKRRQAIYSFESVQRTVARGRHFYIFCRRFDFGTRGNAGTTALPVRCLLYDSIGTNVIHAEHPTVGNYQFAFDTTAEVLFTETKQISRASGAYPI